MEKENNTDESDFSENEIPDLNSLKPFGFEPKINIGVLTVVRNSHQRCSVTKGVLRNSAKLTGKHLCQSLFFNIKKETPAQVFSSEFCEISKNAFFYRTPPDNCFWLETVIMRKKVLSIN